MTPLRIGITGRFRRGKDTVANILTEQLGGSKNVARLAFADALKDELSVSTWNFLIALKRAGVPIPIIEMGYAEFVKFMHEQRDMNGVGWQWLGEFMRQVVSEDYWIKHHDLEDKFDKAVYDKKHIIITDMRHHNECNWLHDRGFFTIRVQGPNHAPGDVRDVDHPSERFIDELPVHHVLWNTSSISWLRELVISRVLPSARRHAESLEPLAVAR